MRFDIKRPIYRMKRALKENLRVVSAYSGIQAHAKVQGDLAEKRAPIRDGLTTVDEARKTEVSNKRLGNLDWRIWQSALKQAGVKCRNVCQPRHTYAPTMLLTDEHPMSVAIQKHT